jgi:DNA primase
MFFGPEFLDLLREKVTLSDLIARRVKLTRKGRESLGLCPFHKEKTPSFTVNDDKGFYHCFGCGAHGDVIRFLTDCEKMPFVEAIETLAQMAGVPLPKPDTKELARQQHQSSLADIMEIACQYFQSQLKTPAGQRACDYLKGRGLTGQTAKTFRLGYAPLGSGLLHELKAKGCDLKQCQKLGLLAFNQTRQQFYDYFYDRVMFPIFDRKKRVIGFSGRMLEKGEPKYLNSPETDLFHKGEQLFGLPFAIETIRMKNEAIVVEGNMDVISLHQHGWNQTVAPLGTAFTEKQVQILWKLCDEPIMCFDGDSAGQRAMIRAMNRALPLLVPGKSLRFAVLPPGMDPDDMMRQKSDKIWKNLIQNAQSFIDVFWADLLATHLHSTPEQRAKLQTDALGKIQQIQDQEIRRLYESEIKQRLKKLLYRGAKKNVNIQLQLPQEDLFLLASLYAYPNELAVFSETLSALNYFSGIRETALFNGWMDAVLEGKELPMPETEKKLMMQIDKIRTSKTAQDVAQEVESWLCGKQLNRLKEEFAQIQAEYFKTENPAIKEEIEALRHQIETFSNMNDE